MEDITLIVLWWCLWLTDGWISLSRMQSFLNLMILWGLRKTFDFFEQQAGLVLLLPKGKMFQLLLLRGNFFYFHLKWDLPWTWQSQTNLHKRGTIVRTGKKKMKYVFLFLNLRMRRFLPGWKRTKQGQAWSCGMTTMKL